jgi:uncharacterized protein (DUF2062 family)
MRKKVRAVFQSILHMDANPKEIALAFALGAFIAFFPIIGTHTALAFGLAWAFRVNPMVTLGGSLVNNPWTIAPIFFGSYYLGVFIMGGERKEINVRFKDLDWHTVMEIIKNLGVPYVVGGLVAGVVAAFASYFIVLRMVTLYRRRAAFPPTK